MNTPQQLREYIFAETDDRDRLLIQYQAYKPSFERVLAQVLDEYSLAQRLQAALDNSAVPATVRILDVGCGEGLYLQKIAATLEALLPSSSSGFKRLRHQSPGYY